MADHQNKKDQTQNEGPIASRLRSKSKILDAKTSKTVRTGGTRVKDSSDKPSQHSRRMADKSNKSAAKKGEQVHPTSTTNEASQPSKDKSTKKNHHSTPKSSKGNDVSSPGTSLPSHDHQGTNNIIKDSSQVQRKKDSKNQNAKIGSTNQNLKNEKPKKEENYAAKMRNSWKPSSSNGHENEKKAIPSHKPPTNLITDHPTHYIRWKGFDTATNWNCDLCEKDLAYSPYSKEWEDSSDEDEEYDLEHLFSSRTRQELEQNSMLPEVSVLPCNHVFHNMCMSFCETEMQLSDPLCPLCMTL